MKRIKKITAGILLGFGLTISLAVIANLLSDVPAKDKQDAVTALVVLGLPLTAAGAWMFWRGHQQYQQQARAQLRTTFFKSLQAHNGRISLIQFAMESGLEGKEAKTYLDERAKEFNATYDVTEKGNISYYFELGDASS
jgi:membrane protease YdiL (CAAX protease family)